MTYIYLTNKLSSIMLIETIRLHGPPHCLCPHLLLAVDVEPDCLKGRDLQLLLDHLPHPDDGVWLGGVSQPNGQCDASGTRSPPLWTRW